MRFDTALPHPLPEIDPALFDELLAESKRFVDSLDCRVQSDELPARFLDFWLLPVARRETERRRFAALYKSNEECVLLQLPLHLFDYVYGKRFDLPPIPVEADCNPVFRTDVELFQKHFHQFYVLLQYIRIMNEIDLVQFMRRFDIFEIEAYDEVITSVLKDWNEHMIRILSEAH